MNLEAVPMKNLQKMTISKSAFLLLILGVLITPIFWIVGDWIDDANKYYLFLFRPEKGQKLHWYLHLSSFKIQAICILIAFYKVCYHHISKASRFILKILIGFSIYRFVEYWCFRYELPIMSIVFVLFVIISVIYVKDGK